MLRVIKSQRNKKVTIEILVSVFVELGKVREKGVSILIALLCHFSDSPTTMVSKFKVVICGKYKNLNKITKI